MNQATNDLLEIAWKAYPHTFAQRASRNKWIAYNWLVYVSVIVADAIYKGDARIILEAPPRHGKSEFISHWLPTWFLELWPEREIMLASYEATMAAKWGRLIRNEFEHNPHLTQSLSADSKAKDKFHTTMDGGMLTGGIGGPFIGSGAHLGIIDDPIKNHKEAYSETHRQNTIDWFKSTFYTRLEPGGSIIVMHQRWSEGDLAGWLQTEHDDDWTVIKLPAMIETLEQALIDPLGRKIGDVLCAERFPAKRLAKIKKGVGTTFWGSMYQQDPYPEDGDLWKTKYFKKWNDTTLPRKFDEIIQSWDLTFKGKEQAKGEPDYVVGQIWGRKGVDLYILDQVRGQWDFPRTKVEFAKLTIKWPEARRKLIEDKANGAAIEADVKHTITGIKMVEPMGGKIARAIACSPTIESGNVYVPEDENKHPWVKIFVAESKKFPKGKNDDTVDAGSQAILNLDRIRNNVLMKMIKG